jgi:hypothetical protein
MALFMDVHTHIEDLTEDGLRQAHQLDLEVQDRFGVKCMCYWFNLETGQVFCLIEAPNKEAANAVHQASHGLVADEIIEVVEGS